MRGSVCICACTTDRLTRLGSYHQPFPFSPLPQRRLLQSSEEQGKLADLVSTLETQLGDVRLQLEEERKNCRLLMDYPFVKQSSEGYGDHLASLHGKRSQRQISANTVRILLLEDQNTELRQNLIVTARTNRRGQEGPQVRTHFSYCVVAVCKVHLHNSYSFG